MKINFRLDRVIVGIVLLTLIISCGKDVLIDVEKKEQVTRKVTLQIKTFESIIKPLQYYKGEHSSDWNTIINATSDRARNVAASSELQYLYIWSFNEEVDKPDVGIDRTQAGISVLLKSGKTDYGSSSIGFSFLTYPKGKSLNVAGPEKITFHMPIPHVSELGLLRFDMSGSVTGPKDFDIYYRIDDEEQTLLSDQNQFSDLSGQNTFEYDLSAIDLSTLHAQQINILIIPKEGQRPDSSNYTNSGTLRIDNFALQGIYTGEDISQEIPKEGTIHFHIFDQESKALVHSGRQNVSTDQLFTEIQFSLDEGDYFMSVLANFSTIPLYIPDDLKNADEYFVSASTKDHQAFIFGSIVEDFVVNDQVSLEIALERYYSEVSFEFTDQLELTEVNRIEIVPGQNMYYSPFNPSFIVPDAYEHADQSRVFSKNTIDIESIKFNQFMGIRKAPMEMSYRLTAYDVNDQVLNEIVTSAEITNNVKLIFSGYLLGNDLKSAQKILIDWEEPWKESVKEHF